MRRPTRPWSQRKLSGIVTLEEKSGWQTFLQAPQDFTTHVCEDLPYVLHCAIARHGGLRSRGSNQNLSKSLAWCFCTSAREGPAVTKYIRCLSVRHWIISV